MEDFPELSSTNPNHFGVFLITNRDIQICMPSVAIVTLELRLQSLPAMLVCLGKSESVLVYIHLVLYKPITIEVPHQGGHLMWMISYPRR